MMLVITLKTLKLSSEPLQKVKLLTIKTVETQKSGEPVDSQVL